MGDLDAVELVRASGPCHEYRCRRCPDVLHIFERAFVFANYEVQVACARHKNVQSQHINRRTRSERAVVVEISERTRRSPEAVGVARAVRGEADVDALEGPVRRHLQEPVRVAPADRWILEPAVRGRVGGRRVLVGEAPPARRVRARHGHRAARRRRADTHRDQQPCEAPGAASHV